jgi:hypothetical protein
MNMNENPSMEQLRDLIAPCSPGTCRYLPWVSTDGEVHVDPLFDISEHDLTELCQGKMLFKLEPLSGGQIGPEAARDKGWLARLYGMLLSEWRKRFDYSPE